LTICAVGHPIFPKQQNDSPRDPDVDELQERYTCLRKTGNPGKKGSWYFWIKKKWGDGKR